LIRTLLQEPLGRCQRPNDRFGQKPDDNAEMVDDQMAAELQPGEKEEIQETNDLLKSMVTDNWRHLALAQKERLKLERKTADFDIEDPYYVCWRRVLDPCRMLFQMPLVYAHYCFALQCVHLVPSHGVPNYG
jgi:hypothetical protein